MPQLLCRQLLPCTCGILAVLIFAISTQARGQTIFDAPIPADEFVSAFDQQPNIEAIYQRLERQDEEIRQLRSALGEMRQDVRLLPPVMNDSQAGPGGSGSLPTASSDKTFALQETAASKPADSKAAPPSPSAYEVGSDKVLIPNWNNGLELKNKEGDYRIKIGGFVQYDICWFDPAANLLASPSVGGIGSDPDSTQIRRARLNAEGTFNEVFDFRFEVEFINDLVPAAATAGQPVADAPGLTDMWVQWTHIPYIGIIRVGNQKEAMGLEHIEAPPDLSFMEPSYLFDMLWGPFNFGFNPGVAILNQLDDQRWTYEIGVWGNNSNPFGYSIGEDWALTGRTTCLLYYDEPSQGRYMWEVGCSGSLRQPDQDTVRLRDRGDIRSGPNGVLNPIYADTGTMGADAQDIVALETFAQYGPWSIQAEYAGTWIRNATQPITPVPVNRGTPFFQGGYVEVWYFVTGENRVFNKFYAVPAKTIPWENVYAVRNCSNCCFGRGAWQVGVRYNVVDLNDNGINGGILNSFTFGVNWFLTPNAKVQFNYDFTNRSQVKTVEAGDINSFGIRFQYVF